MNPVRELRWRVGLTQAALAAAAGTSQPTIAAYESGSKSPTLRTIAGLAEAAGLEAMVAFVPPLTREDRRSLELHRRVASLVARDPAPVLRRARRNVARMRKANPHASPLLDEWRSLLRGSIEHLLNTLIDPGMHARDLRHVTPFAGVVSPRERWMIASRTSAV